MKGAAGLFHRIWCPFHRIRWNGPAAPFHQFGQQLVETQDMYTNCGRSCGSVNHIFVIENHPVIVEPDKMGSHSFESFYSDEWLPIFIAFVIEKVVNFVTIFIKPCNLQIELPVPRIFGRFWRNFKQTNCISSFLPRCNGILHTQLNSVSDMGDVLYWIQSHRESSCRNSYLKRIAIV